MNKNELPIAQVVVGLPIEGPFDYLLEGAIREKALIGARALVPFGARKMVGYIVGFKKISPYRKLKSIFSLIDETPILNEHFLRFTKEFGAYYACSWGEAIDAALPEALRKGKPVSLDPFSSKEVSPGKPAAILLHDPDRQKGWQILLEKIQETLSSGRSVIFLVPEAVKVPEIYGHLKEGLKEPVSALDKTLSAGEELKQWASLYSGEAQVLIGTRSAIFAPLQNLGLIVVYEENNSAYKQEQSPFYHARDAARMRADIESCSVIFENSVPSTEIWHLAVTKKIQYIFCKDDSAPLVQVVDTSDRGRKTSILSYPLRNHMQKILGKKGKVLLFMNRKGFTTKTRCTKCGFVLKCKRCDTNLTFLYNKKKMVCRHCNYKTNPPGLCPKCSSSYLRFTGMGGEKLESEVSRLFPGARVERFDKDTHELPGTFDILIGTQAVLKLEGKLKVTLCGVFGVDGELNRIDFRSAEKVFSLLMRLRSLSGERLMVQTANPDNYAVKESVKGNFERFYKKELKFRRETGFPPFHKVVAITLRGAKEDQTFEGTKALYELLVKNNHSKAVEIAEPIPEMIPKLRDKYRFTILIKGKTKAKLMPLIHKSIKEFGKKGGMIISVNVDP